MINGMTKDGRTAEILSRALDGERLTYEDGVYLFSSNEVAAIGYAANEIRRRKKRQQKHTMW